MNLTKKKRGGRGRSQATKDLIDTCLKIIESVQPISVRGVAYKLFVIKLISSMAKNNTGKVSHVLTVAREEGLIPWEWIVDETRNLESEPGWANPVEFFNVVALSYRRDFWADQKYRVIVVSEKSTVSGVLRPILDAYGVAFLPVKGFNSASKIHEAAVAMNGDKRTYVFLYVGDYDCSGMYMSEVDFPRRLIGAQGLADADGADRFRFTRIALTPGDVGDLPGFPASDKRKDPRYKWFVENYGNHCWEVDAMDPQELRDRVEYHILQYIDADAWERHKAMEEVQRASSRMYAAGVANLEEWK